jgi:hypothetical protein
MNPNVNKLLDYERVSLEKDNLLRSADRDNARGYAVYEKLSKM